MSGTPRPKTTKTPTPAKPAPATKTAPKSKAMFVPRTMGDMLATKAARQAKAPAAPVADVAAADDPAERSRLAKIEHKVLAAWAKDGSKPPRPATPNLDAVHAESSTKPPKPAKVKTPRAPKVDGEKLAYVVVKVPADLHKKIKAAATRDGVHIADVVRSALAERF